MFEKAKKEVSKRVKMIANTELNNANLVKTINMKLAPVAAYAMNICRFTVGELKELNKTIKRELRGKDKQEMNNCTRREKGGRGLK